MKLTTLPFAIAIGLLVSSCVTSQPVPLEYLTVSVGQFRGSGETFERVDFDANITEVLNKYAKEGWACVAMSVFGEEPSPRAYLVLARPRTAAGGK